MCWLWRASTSAPPLPTAGASALDSQSFLCREGYQQAAFLGPFSSKQERHKHSVFRLEGVQSVSKVSASWVSPVSCLPVEPLNVDKQRLLLSISGRVSGLALPLPVSAEAYSGIPFKHFLREVPLSHSAMSFWTCPTCTFVNQGSSNKCEMCEQLKKSSSSSVRSSVPFLSLNSSQQESASKWGCRTCTFLNKDSDSRCEICGTLKSSISLDSFAEIDSTLDDDAEGGENSGIKFWPLRSCTGALPESQESSQKHVEVSSPSTSTVPLATQERQQHADRKRKHQEDGDAVLSNESDVGQSTGVSNAMLRNLHLEKMQRNMQSQAGANQGSHSPPRTLLSRTLATDSSSIGDNKQSIVILTYNIWFREDLEVVARMNAIGTIILKHNPHFICFQEVTPAIYGLFQCSSWWGRYKCSVPPGMAGKRAYFCLLLSKVDSVSFQRKSYNNSVMGRELCIAETDAGGGAQLVIATTHLESPCPAPPTWDQMFSPERVSQAKQALNTLMGHRNVVFGGDMNWDDKLDGAPPLPADWCDAWVTLRPNEEGLTYDSKQNPLLTGSRLRKRLDRIFCRLQDFNLESIEMVGTKPIPGVMFEKEIKAKKQAQKVKLPVLPSDHFGLLLKVIQKEQL
ncbi:hypothetical protein GOP47_0012649 [Adiantum capillus-veneris]|uniref:RanBP2-type domain-containing protein n=1 Tax=Adiantum capillus-veneris TaxID=13818 RepID=A0A9D4USG0_ADICA|nr:hypothetical protein GOP47_0012649 [Adiantum capillus-veneris]